MATFLDDLSIYNAKAAAAITLASAAGDSGKANLMSSLKTTANDTSLTEAVRLNALTALINVGNLLDIPLPPYFPITTTFANSQTYVGLHNDLTGLNVEPYLHITSAEKSFFSNKANLADISFGNLSGVYTSNAGLTAAINAKQNALNGTGFVKASGGTITYDNSTFLTSVTGIVAANTPGGGQLTGTYASPTLSNAAVIGQLLTGFNPNAATGVLSNTDSIFSAVETLNANINNVIATSGTISSISFALPSSVFSYTAGPFTSGAANISATFISKPQNHFFAGPTGGGTGTPNFRAIVAGDFPVSGAAANTYGSPSSIPQITVDVYGRVTAITNVTAASGGQVNTIVYNVPSPVFTTTVVQGATATITLGLSTQTANTVWAGPVSGAAATPGFRSLVAADIPNIAISQVTGLPDTLSGFLTDSLSDGSIWIGNTSNAAVQRVLSGDVTMSNTGVTAIGLAKVQYDMIQEVTTQTLLGRYDALNGEVQQITLLGTDFVLNSGTGVLSLASPVAPVVSTKGDLLGHDLTVQQRVPSSNVDGDILLVNNSATGTYTDLGLNWVTMSGDATIAASGAITIATGAVTLGKMANLAANSFIGNNTGSSATPIALTVTEATAMLQQFSSTRQGVVPAVTGAAIGDATYFLNATGGWAQPGGGGGGSGTVTSIATAGLISGGTITTTGTITTSMSTNKLVGRGTAGTGIMEEITLGTGLSLTGTTLNATGGSGTVTSVGLTMPAAFTVTPSTTNPITTSGTFAVTGAGTVSQYVRGDGTLANFPASGGGGSSLSYYLNGSVTQFGTYKQMNRVPVNGAGTNFQVTNTTGYALMAQFVTDANDPSLLNIPAGAWDIGFYFSSSNNTGSPAFYVELLKYDGTTFTPIASSSANAEIISNGTAVDLYNTSLAVSSTSLTLTDRLVIRVYVDTAGSRTITFHTEDGNLAQIITTFTTGLTALNGLTAQVQFFANGSTGTAPAFVSSTATHTLNIPLASASSVTAGLISKTEYDTFNGKLANVLTTTGDIIYSSSGTTAARLGIGTANQVLAVSAGLIPEWKTIAAGGDVTGPSSSTDGNFAVFNSTTGKIIMESAGASLSAAGAAVFNTSVTVGVSTSTTGQLIFRNATTSATTTLLASTSQSANLIYTWPISAPTVGQILSSDASGNLSWTAAGAGDMTLAGTQTVTGTKTFNAGAIRINNATNNGYHILASLAGVLGTLTATFPAATGTVPLLSLAQTFSALQTFSAGLTVSAGTTTISGAASISGAATFSGVTTSTNTVSISASGSTTNAQLSVAGGTINWMTFGTGATGAPVFISSTRSVGTKVVVYQSTGSNFDNAIGVETSGMWLSTTQGIRFYTNNTTTVRAAFDGDASNSNLTLTNATAVSLVAATATTANVFNTVATTVNIAGAATTLNIGGPATTLAIGNTATAAQTVNMFTASTASSIYNFATGATANGSTKTINIGTAGLLGSTTIVNIGSAVASATNTIAIRGNLTLGTSGGNMGFWGTAAVARQTIASDTLANLYTALRAYGLIL
jgi:hypothetical protein